MRSRALLRVKKEMSICTVATVMLSAVKLINFLRCLLFLCEQRVTFLEVSLRNHFAETLTLYMYWHVDLVGHVPVDLEPT